MSFLANINARSYRPPVATAVNDEKTDPRPASTPGIPIHHRAENDGLNAELHADAMSIQPIGRSVDSSVTSSAPSLEDTEIRLDGDAQRDGGLPDNHHTE
jgi:hypothetical protein